ncbi:MAG: hypothetical protein WEB53_11480 [Akkermansiaceae bacterium]
MAAGHDDRRRAASGLIPQCERIHTRRPHTSPLWQIVHYGWDAFLTLYEKHHRKSLGPLAPVAVVTVQSFLHPPQCPDSGHERLLPAEILIIPAPPKQSARGDEDGEQVSKYLL